jgi:hypothetical protein
MSYSAYCNPTEADIDSFLKSLKENLLRCKEVESPVFLSIKNDIGEAGEFWEPLAYVFNGCTYTIKTGQPARIAIFDKELQDHEK